MRCLVLETGGCSTDGSVLVRAGRDDGSGWLLRRGERLAGPAWARALAWAGAGALASPRRRSRADPSRLRVDSQPFPTSPFFRTME